MANPGRTLIVCTRHSNGRLATTYCNDLDSSAPYTITVLSTANDRPAGLEPEDVLPHTGETKVYLHRWNNAVPS